MEAITIEKTANGFMVRPAGGCYSIKDASVFQDMGYASAARDHQKASETLLGFIEDYFHEENR